MKHPILLRALAVLLLAALLCASCAAPKHASRRARHRIPVVLDTDIGADIDDTWALAQLLRSPELDLKLVLCDTGNTEYRARVAAKFLQVAGRTNVPVGLGPAGAPSPENQLPWVKDYALTDYPGAIYTNGVDAFIRLVKASPEPVTLIAIGPVPNIAEALRRDPSIASKVRFVGMQGSIDVGYGAGSAPAPEANVAGDVAAFRAVLAAPWASLEITPLDTCGFVVLGGTNYQRLLHSKDPMIQALLENYRIWSGLVTWMKADFFEQHTSTLFDTVAVYMAYDGSLLEFETVPISVTDKGMTVRDVANGRPTRCAMRWKNLDAYEAALTARLLGEDTGSSAPR
jgi:inosine-uridine nucleoside N-ribohydrolase